MPVGTLSGASPVKLLRRSDKDTDSTQDNEFKTRMLILEASRLAGKLHEQLKELEALQEEGD